MRAPRAVPMLVATLSMAGATGPPGAAQAAAPLRIVGKPIVTVRESANFVVVYFRLNRFAPRRQRGYPLAGPIIDAYLGQRDPGPIERPSLYDSDYFTLTGGKPCYGVVQPRRRDVVVRVGEVVRFNVSLPGSDEVPHDYGRAFKPRGLIANGQRRYRKQLGCN